MHVLRNRRAALTFIFITVTIDMLSFGIIAPVLPKLIVGFYGGRMVDAAWITGLFGIVWALMQFVCSPILGILSDRFGRRPVILLSNLGMALDYLVMALAPTVGWLFVGRILSGMTSASMTTAGAYISDVTTQEKRAAGFGIISAAFGIGFIVGPAIGGLLGGMNPRLPFWVAGGFCLINWLYGFFVLPESLPKEKRRTTFDWRRANPLGSLRLLRSHRELSGLATINFIGYLAHEVFTVWVLYTMYRYAWSPGANGASLAVVGVTSVIVSLWCIKPIVARFGERRTLLIGLFFGAAGMAMFGVAPNGWIFLLGIPVMMLWSIYSPAAQSLMTRHVRHDEQGELQGALGSLRSFAMILGPGIFAGIFATFIGNTGLLRLAGAPWYLACGLLLFALALAWRTTQHEPDRVVLAPSPELSPELDAAGVP
ncbi:MAG TPA: TCR/Tet family MFS transporter [Candidatus Baltobacteraceae bacterium]|jgi:DHA1 family tetracycline resistance protein-like MFS transporter